MEEIGLKKDIIYVVGSVSESKIKTLWFVYGDCYAADKSIREKNYQVFLKVHEIDHLEFKRETNENCRSKKEKRKN